MLTFQEIEAATFANKTPLMEGVGVIRSKVDSELLLEKVQTLIRSKDDGLTSIRFVSMQEVVDESSVAHRLVGKALNAFMVCSLFIFVVGMANLAYYSRYRTLRELRIRLSVGMSPVRFLMESCPAILLYVGVGSVAGGFAARLLLPMYSDFVDQIEANPFLIIASSVAFVRF